MVDGPFGSDLKSEEYVDEGVPLIQLNNIGVGVHTASNLKFITEDKAATLARHCAVPGDLVIAKMAEPVARAAVVSNDFPRYTIVADCIKLSVDATEWLPQFLNYWMNSAVVRSIAEVYSAGITRLRINLGAVKKLPVFELPLPEQNAIADFLDRETAKIDTLVAEQEQLITLLKEKRQAVISHAVTKGLDPSVPMKDSGVEWLGEVPAHWEVTHLKRRCAVITDGAHISPETEGGVHLFVSTKDISDDGIDFDSALRTSPASYEYMIKTGCQPIGGDVLFSKDGTIGRTVVVNGSIEFVIASSLIIIRPIPDQLNSDFLNALCQSWVVSQQVDGFVKGAGLPRLSIQNLLKVVGVFPPIDEQVQIANYLSDLDMRSRTLALEAERTVALLKERRSALISAAVTGQIDVRGLPPAQEQAA